MPVEDYKIALTEKGIEAYISRDPGRYLCNYAYYLALRKNKGHALFVHLPKVSEDLPLEDIEKAAEVLSNLIK